MVATTWESTTTTTPSRFNFLKEGLLLPSHNRRLFAAVFSIIVASTCLLLVGDHVVLHQLPLDEQIRLDDTTTALNSTDDPSRRPDHLVLSSLHDTRVFLLTCTAYLLLAVVTVVSAVRLLILFAAVATYSGSGGEPPHTLASLLGTLIRTRLKGPVLTLAFVYALETAYVALLAAMFALLVVLAIKDCFAWFCVVLLVFLVPLVVLLVYFSFLCSMSVVVAVAEPGCHGAGALVRAWRLMKGRRRRRQAALLIFVTSLLAAAVLRVYALAKRYQATDDDMAAGLLLGFLYVVLMSAVHLFEVCAMVALYYECRGSTEASVAEYLMVSTKEQFDAA